MQKIGRTHLRKHVRTSREIDGSLPVEKRKMRKLHAVIACILGSTASSCSNTIKSEARTSFMGHTIGENSMTWSSEESYGDTDPLTRCREILRSDLLEQSLEPVHSCRDFVNRGTYRI